MPLGGDSQLRPEVLAAMLRQILWCLCLGTGSDPKLQEQIRTPSFNELKSLGACPKTSDFSLRLHGFARRLAKARGMKLSLSLRAGSENSFEFVIPC